MGVLELALDPNERLHFVVNALGGEEGTGRAAAGAERHHTGTALEAGKSNSNGPMPPGTDAPFPPHRLCGVQQLVGLLPGTGPGRSGSIIIIPSRSGGIVVIPGRSRGIKLRPWTLKGGDLCGEKGGGGERDGVPARRKAVVERGVGRR